MVTKNDPERFKETFLLIDKFTILAFLGFSADGFSGATGTTKERFETVARDLRESVKRAQDVIALSENIAIGVWLESDEWGKPVLYDIKKDLKKASDTLQELLKKLTRQRTNLKGWLELIQVTPENGQVFGPYPIRNRVQSEKVIRQRLQELRKFAETPGSTGYGNKPTLAAINTLEWCLGEKPTEYRELTIKEISQTL